MSTATDIIGATAGVAEAVIAYLSYRETRAQRLMAQTPAGPINPASGQGTIGWQQPVQPSAPPYAPSAPYAPYAGPPQPAGQSWQQPQFRAPVPQRAVPGALATFIYAMLFGIALLWIGDSPVGVIGQVIVAGLSLTVVAAVWLALRHKAPEWSALLSWLLTMTTAVPATVLIVGAFTALIS
ncbi:hypothetical protein ETD83_34585 [Actinomadura soli]|uniref:Uncharacterized protein n=1 Tax=Actinomadura soli TaxID=2508997 RepID=A0A5C4J226_9ACTN|nr:hypothetical protein [Actinomadura soli]TMQ90642.1 hypothetical protein ETD83_34585 [Actinomadura soli]